MADFKFDSRMSPLNSSDAISLNAQLASSLTRLSNQTSSCDWVMGYEFEFDIVLRGGSPRVQGCRLSRLEIILKKACCKMAYYITTRWWQISLHPARQPGCTSQDCRGPSRTSQAVRRDLFRFLPRVLAAYLISPGQKIRIPKAFLRYRE